MGEFMSELLHTDYFGWTLIGAAIVFISTVRSVAGILKTRERERTRREIAAFIAEGSMTPEQGERLIKAGGSIDA